MASRKVPRMSDPVTPEIKLPRRYRRRLFRHFRKNKDGVTAVEFALVAMPFFMVMFSILEIALTFWVSQVLETMVADASRQIYTGQFQQATAGQTPESMASAFKDLICGPAGSPKVMLFDCRGKIQIDVRASTTNPDPITSPVSQRRMDTSGWGYRDSRPGEVVVVRAAMEYPTFTSGLTSTQTALANGNRVIMATATFRNEPFQ